MKFHRIFVVTVCLSSCGISLVEPSLVNSTLPDWQAGMLDIHHINTGRGDAAFMVFPDGTTLLFDAGSVDETVTDRHPPLKLSDAKPNANTRPGERIASYIEQVAPTEDSDIDYGLISHFHSDHYGNITEISPKSSHGDWRLSGFTDVAEVYNFNMVIDRAYPNYDTPMQVIADTDKTFANYSTYLNAAIESGKTNVAALRPGDNSQIVLKKNPADYPEFSVRGVSANGVIWAGSGLDTKNLFTAEVLTFVKGRFNENPLSLAITVNYGDFDYFTGGDLTGSQALGEPEWFDVETPLSESVGEIDVVALNHHGNRDATNANFLQNLTPRVLVQQSWISDHPGGEVVHRMVSKTLWQGERDIFSTNMLDETKIAIGPWLTKNYKSMQGHIVIRVRPGGDEYMVYILDDSREKLFVKDKFGPYKSR